MKSFKFIGVFLLMIGLMWSLSFFTISCGDDDDDPTPTPTPTFTPTQGEYTPTPPPEGNQVGDTPFDFTLNDRNETPHTLSDYKGNVILLDLTAMWCGPCRQEAAAAEEMYQDYKDRGFNMLTVLIENNSGNQPNASSCATWANQFGLTFPVLYDVDYQVYRLFNTTDYIPLNIIIDRNFVIQYADTGYNEGIETQMRNLIESLL